MASAKCMVCGKTAYAAEQVRPTDDVVLHKNCFKCEQCHSLIKLGNFASLDGKYYCKPHFKQLFALKGNYNEGFGTEKHSTLWRNKDENGEEKKEDAKEDNKVEKKEEEKKMEKKEEKKMEKKEEKKEDKKEEKEEKKDKKDLISIFEKKASSNLTASNVPSQNSGSTLEKRASGTYGTLPVATAERKNSSSSLSSEKRGSGNFGNSGVSAAAVTPERRNSGSITPRGSGNFGSSTTTTTTTLTPERKNSGPTPPPERKNSGPTPPPERKNSSPTTPRDSGKFSAISVPEIKISEDKSDGNNAKEKELQEKKRKEQLENVEKKVIKLLDKVADRKKKISQLEKDFDAVFKVGKVEM